jgi:hypothetical protein
MAEIYEFRFHLAKKDWNTFRERMRLLYGMQIPSAKTKFSKLEPNDYSAVKIWVILHELKEELRSQGYEVGSTKY